MKLSRKQFLRTAGLGLGTLALAKPAEINAAADSPSFLQKKPTMKMGMVTYNLGKDWDIETIIKNCTEARFSGVELRTSHAHKVEVNLSAAERAEVKKRFQDSPVELSSLGSAFDYHTPDAAKLRKDIEATKLYITLAHDVGATGIKVRPNALPASVPKEQTLEQIGKSLGELGQFADQYGLVIRLEVHGKDTSLLPNIKTIMDVADRKNVGVCWNSNQTDLDGEGFDHNFDLVKGKILQVHMRDLYLEEYPFRRLMNRLNETGYTGYCLAEIPESTDPVRVMRYYRALWLAYQGLL